MIGPESELLGVIERFQLAALGEVQWLDAIAGLAAATGSRSGQMIGLGNAAAVPFNWMTEMPPEASEHFVAVGGGDPRINRRVGVGGSVPELHVVADADFPAYGRPDDPPELIGWFERFDIPHICLSPLLKEDGILVGLAVLRSEKNGHITAEQKRVFAHLAPHVRAAVRTQMALHTQGAAMITGAMEALSIAAFVCDMRGKVLACTPMAEQRLADGTHLKLQNRALFACNPADARVLAAAVFTAAFGGGAESPPGSIILRDAEGHDPVLVEVASLPLGRHAFGFDAAALVTVRPRRTADGRAELVARALYGLTATEAAIAADMVSGLAPQAIAQRRGAAVTTIRTHIRRIFEKAAVTSQLELVAELNNRL